MNPTHHPAGWLLTAAAWWLAWTFLGQPAWSQPLGLGQEDGGRSSFQGRRTPLVDGQPLVNRRPRQQEPENLFSWLGKQGRRFLETTRTLFAGRESAPKMNRPKRMNFPYLGNRPATKPKKETSFWSRWWPFGSRRK